MLTLFFIFLLVAVILGAAFVLTNFQVVQGARDKVFGTKSERLIKRLRPTVDTINSFEPELEKLGDEQLRAKTDAFRKRLADGETLDDLLPEAFATVREVGKRTLGLRHFDVQMIGGMVLHSGKIAEMRTGEGKTLVATLPVYLNAIEGKGVHVVTVNDYLAKRDAEWMRPIYEGLGLSVGFVQNDMRGDIRVEAYEKDVTYVTNNELGFDYLRDNMVIRKEERVLRNLNYAIIDEVDSILIDEARTPLIISGPSEESTDKYAVINRVIPQLKVRFITEKEEIESKYTGEDLGKGWDAIVDEKNHSATITEEGNSKCEKLLDIKNLYDDVQSEWVHHITQGLRAHHLYKRDVHYVVKDGEIVIVDEFTGRLMPGRRWSDGLHQAVEAKESVAIKEENQTLATVTFQNFFKMFGKRSGMTGTALTEEEEFQTIYGLEVVVMPTNRPNRRDDQADRVYRTQREKYNAVLGEIETLWKAGRPILVGTRSIEVSELLAGMLRPKGIPHQVLNAKYHEMEAQIIAQAGRKSAVTIATNMAGRGTDIVLGGNPPDEAEQKGIKEAGGLAILGTERHESRRIDNQLRGRCGRQGDPGSTTFYLSLEDELMRLFGSDRVSGLMQKLGMEDGEVIESGLVSRQIEIAQKRVEGQNFDIRKQLQEYDNVMNLQRTAVYKMRNEVLDGVDCHDRILAMIDDSIRQRMDQFAPEAKLPESWDFESLAAFFSRTFATGWPYEKEEDLWDIPREEIHETLKEKAEASLANREAEFAESDYNFRETERTLFLQVLDQAWKNHLYELDQVKKGIGFRAYAQKDPLVEYQREAFSIYEEMLDRVRDQTLEYLLHIGAPPRRRRTAPVGTAIKPDAESAGAASPEGEAGEGRTATATATRKIGRNDPCHCGSGKKFKKCHGR